MGKSRLFPAIGQGNTDHGGGCGEPDRHRAAGHHRAAQPLWGGARCGGLQEPG
jgi:hypothetical protein